ncbi:hypothetical protein SLS57_000927 [Botryosphaeria dothidea]
MVRSAIYSSRPADYVGELITGGEKMEHMPNNHMWRAQRKIVAQTVTPRTLDAKVAPLQEAENAVLLHDLLRTPADFSQHVKRTAVSVANIIVWGHRGPTFDSFWGGTPYRSLAGFSAAMELGANPPIEQFPFLKLLPERLAPWVRRAKVPNAAMKRTWGEARRLAEARRARGVRREAMFDRIVDGEIVPDVPIGEAGLNHFLGTMVEGGSETSAGQMLTSILHLALHPEVQAKAREELDVVCGPDRYVGGALGVPHSNTQDDWYEGMFIPKGSMIVLPIYAVNRLESNGYKDPAVYNPDRWIGQTRIAAELAGLADYENRDNYGAGRRVCPGMHLAERTMWRMTAKILWAFEIIPIDVDPENYNEGIMHAPEPYKLEFRPRSDAHVKTIMREAEPALEFLAKYE